MNNPPQYRQRLFLSVDLAGSTAYKSGTGAAPIDGNASRFQWVQRIRDFYRVFPKLVSTHYDKQQNVVPGKSPEKCKAPQVWKTVGDEILFCCRVVGLRHTAISVLAFLRALDEFGQLLDDNLPNRDLDIKGAGWICAFPAVNVTVPVDYDAEHDDSEQNDEAFEVAADENPRQYDFLGNGIDCGFRVARHSTTDRFVASVELAWLLAEAAHKKLFVGDFFYHERHILKGVLRDRPYPVVSINTERSDSRREVKAAERIINGQRNVDPLEIRNFLKLFMQDERIEPPLPDDSGVDLPETYIRFRDAWIEEANALSQTKKTEASGDQDEGSGTDLPDEVQTSVDEATRDFINEVERSLKNALGDAAAASLAVSPSQTPPGNGT